MLLAWDGYPVFFGDWIAVSRFITSRFLFFSFGFFKPIIFWCLS
jgi:hypothetical protein